MHSAKRWFNVIWRILRGSASGSHHQDSSPPLLHPSFDSPFIHCSSITPVIPLLPGSYTDKHKHRRAYKTFEEGRIINLIIGLAKQRSLTLVLQLYVAAKFIYL